MIGARQGLFAITKIIELLDAGTAGVDYMRRCGW